MKGKLGPAEAVETFLQDKQPIPCGCVGMPLTLYRISCDNDIEWLYMRCVSCDAVWHWADWILCDL